jgi:HEAT repeat protein
MELHDIEVALQQEDFQIRLQAIAALKTHDAAIAVPILICTLHDPEFLVRTFVARGLGKHQIAEAFAALLEMLKWDNTPSVRAEAANSLSLLGRTSVSHLVLAFEQDTHWLVRRSILAALMDMDCPQELLEICTQAQQGDDLAVRESAIDALLTLVDSDQWAIALSQLELMAQDESPRIRMRVAQVLRPLNDPTAHIILNGLRQDPDLKVVAATWSNPLAEEGKS